MSSRRPSSRASHALIAALFCCLAAPVTVLLGRQTPQGVDTPASAKTDKDILADKLATWAAAFSAHTPGVRDEAVDSISKWSRADLVAVLAELRKTADLPVLNSQLKRAAMLHTDISALNRFPAGYTLPPAERDMLVINDGERVGIRSGTIHWEFARLVLDSLKPSPSRDPSVLHWYRATTAFLQSWAEHVEAQPHLSRGLQMFPSDPVLLLYGGTLHQAYGEPPIQNAYGLVQTPESDAPFTLTRQTASTIPVAGNPGNSAAERRDAEALIRRALSADDTLTEARIRLGYLLGLRGRQREAIAELERSLKDETSRDMRFFALLFLGRAQHAVGNFRAASDAFGRAVALFPGAASARLGLSLASRNAGDLDGAAGALRVMHSSAQSPARYDPWRIWDAVHEPTADALMAELRRTFLR